MKRRTSLLALSLALLSLLFAGPLLASPGQIRRASAADRIPNRYIVVLQNVLKPAVPAVAAALVSQYGGTLRRTMNNAATAFSVEMTEQQALRLTYDPRVLLVEENRLAWPASSQPLPANGLLWGLDRLDQGFSAWLPDGTYRDLVYNYCEQARDVIVYVLDTGINKEHTQFLRPDGSSRVINGVKFANDTHIRPGEDDDYGTWPCGAWTDNLNGGHGTSVASIIGGNPSMGNSLGVAKNVTLVPLRIWDCIGNRGEVEWMAWALDWIRSPANPNRDRRPALVNISFRFFDSDPLTGAFEHVINGIVLDSPGWTGIPVIVSANNQDSRYSRTSPARMAYRNETDCTTPPRDPVLDPPCLASPGRVISVGGIAENDARWKCVVEPPEPCNLGEPGSNYGYTVDIYAPCPRIESAHIACSTCVRTVPESRSGTSFSAAFVSGIVARMLQVTPTLTPVQVWQQLQADATRVGFIDEVTGNDMVIFRAGTPVCSPEFP